MTAVRGDTVVILAIDSNIAFITRKGVTEVSLMTAPAKIVSGYTMVPLRLISEAFGAKVAWDAGARLVSVATIPAKEELVIALDRYTPGKKPPEGFGVATCTQIFEPLLFLNKKLEIQPGLVTSWERLDSLRWRFKLRKGVKFHNGKEFDAESAKFAFTQHLRGAGSIAQRVSAVVDYDSFAIIDKYTLEIKTLKPFPLLPHLMTHTHIAAVEPEAFKKGEIVGTGPFKFKEEVKDQYVVVERNDEYWGSKPYFKRIVFKIIPDANTRAMALQRGEVDVALYPPYPLVKELKKEFNVVVARRGHTPHIIFNLNRPELSDKRLRMALSMAIDKKKITETVHENLAQPAKTLIPPELIFSAANEMQGFSYDSAKAKELLQEAGYQDTDNNGYVDKDGKDLELKLVYTHEFEPSYEGMALAIADYYRAIGIKINLVRLSVADFSKEVLDKGNFDLTIYTGGIFWGAPSSTLSDQFYSKSGIIDKLRFIDPKYDELLEAGMELESKKDFSGAAEKYKELQKYVFEEKVVQCPLVHLNHIVVSKKNVKNLSPFPFYWLHYNGDPESELVKVSWED
ncbi:MAG: ABC transporter substrate-binding protein [Bacillota bacterium]|nr:ABC transporter substrate-binding protein [Bacillota bacterium]